MFKNQSGFWKMAQWIKALAGSLIGMSPGTLTVEEQNCVPQVALCPPHGQQRGQLRSSLLEPKL